MILPLLAVLTLMVATSRDLALGQGVPQEALAGSNEESEAIFDAVQIGISTGNVEILAKHFAPHVGISLRGDENGTFSSKQAYYVLVNFFRTRKFAHFRFSTVSESATSPYATGGVEFTHKGARARAQVYVALMIDGRKHVITQLSIY